MDADDATLVGLIVCYGALGAVGFFLCCYFQWKGLPLRDNTLFLLVATNGIGAQGGADPAFPSPSVNPLFLVSNHLPKTLYSSARALF